MSKVVSKELYDFLKTINFRHKYLFYYGYGFELLNIFQKNLNTKKDKYEKIIGELFYDRVSEKMGNHIYDSNDWLYLINKELYDPFNSYSTCEQLQVYNNIQIDTKILVAQGNSLISRPNNLKLPIDCPLLEFSDIHELNNFCRIGLYEKQLYTNDRYREGYKIKTIYGGIVFNQEIDFPYYEYELDIKNIFNSTKDIYSTQVKETPILSHISTYDMFENYKILWVSKELISNLGLKIGEFTKGLYATDDKNEIILKFNHWNSKYLKDDVRGIPSLSGSELLLRKDYYDLLKKLNGNKCYFLNVVV